MSILVLNAGSSTLKYVLFADDTVAERSSGVVDWQSGTARVTIAWHRADGTSGQQTASVTGYGDAVAHVLRLAGEVQPLAGIRACGHRIVHGGERFQHSMRIDAGVRQGIGALAELAPLHNPPALAAIDAAMQALPAAAHVAVFDTAFFAEQPPERFLYPLPLSWYADWGVRRFGFHGISHHYCTLRVAEMLGRNDARLVICHLGNGCSASAVQGGRALLSTMGYTPLEGLMMGTRSGSIDPAIVLDLLRRGLLTADQIDDALSHRSGLLGVSGVSADFRAVEAAAKDGHDRARLALRLYVDRIRAAIGALAVTMGGLDVLVFTAGVGEHSAWLRGEVCRGLECLGVPLDAQANAACQADADIAPPAAPVRVLVLHTREELLIAREAARLCHQDKPRDERSESHE
jgi:acetate kinase